jgi:AcrR family transcriptional regulator
LLTIAAGLMAEHGYNGMSIYDLGAAAGVTGPALYRHFATKQALLAELLVSISQRLLEEGQSRAVAAHSPREALDALIAWHISFALGEPNLIRVHDRDFASMTVGDRRKVQSLQRQYIDIWVEQLRLIRPELSKAAARATVQSVFGLLNSTPHSAKHIGNEEMADLLTRMALSALIAA